GSAAQRAGQCCATLSALF
ncbi:hypothetical protein A2U01_0101115, partial [Trifolium medium]|nr:hypothetical protein [Trifolium medium]